MDESIDIDHVRGRTLITRAAPETTDDEEAQRPMDLGSAAGPHRPFLSQFAEAVDGFVLGRTRVTEALPETTDEALESTSIAEVSLARGRTVTTRTGAETSDDELS